MPGFHDYLPTAAANNLVGGVSVAEGCPPGNLNDAIRQIMADARALADEVAAIAPGMPVSGGSFTGDILRGGRGGYFHHASSALSDGRVHVLPEGSALPAGAEGVLVFFYA
jgi:hypothetical protein